MAEFLYSEQFFFISDQILSPQEIAFNWSKILIRYKKSDNLDTKYHVSYEMRSNIAPLTDLSSRWVANSFLCEAGAGPAVSRQLSPSLRSPLSEGEEEGNC